MLLRAAELAVKTVGPRRDLQEAPTLRPAEFVRGGDDPVRAAEAGSGQLAKPLGGVAEKLRARAAAARGQRGPRLQDAGLIVCGHDGDGGGRGRAGKQFFQRGGRNDAGAVNLQPHDARLAEAHARRLEHAGMLGRADGDARRWRERARPVREHGVGALGRAGGEHEAGGLAVEQRGELLARDVEADFHAGGGAGRAGGVLPRFVLRAQPRLTRDRRERGGGVVIEVGHARRRMNTVG